VNDDDVDFRHFGEAALQAIDDRSGVLNDDRDEPTIGVTMKTLDLSGWMASLTMLLSRGAYAVRSGVSRSAAHRAIHAGLALTALAWTGVGHADEVCGKGYRAVTESELATIARSLEAAAAALPAAPEGWVADADETSVPSTVCRDREAQPWRYNLRRTYRHAKGAEARADAMDAAARSAAAATAAKKPRLDALEGRMEQLARQFGEAAAAGQTARADRLMRESETVRTEYERVLNEGGAMDQLKAKSTALMRDQQMEIRVLFNALGATVGADAKRLPARAGLQAAHRWSDTGSEFPQDRAILLIGDWRPAQTGGVSGRPRAGASPQQAHNLVVELTADPTRVQGVIDSIRVDRLESLLR
jgi:hypothetical protein